MNKLSRRPLFLLLLYVVGAIVLTLIILRNQARNPEPEQPAKEEKGKSSNKLEPHELFYLDRNYPQEATRPDLFQERLRAAIAYDKATKSSDRGLDYPWTIEGPGNIGGRVNAIAVHPDDPDIILIGYSQGGLYRTADGGQDWIPVFDDQASLSISHITFDPHDPDRVWATTGDVNISGYPFLGSGVYRSNDAGQTWNYSGLDQTGVLSKVLVDPNDPDIIYVGSMGYPSQKGFEKGLFRSVNGGASWLKTLSIDDSTGVIDVVTDPTMPGRLFASGWTRLRSNTKGTTLGPGTSLYKSEDYGLSWTNVTHGLPAEEHSRTSIEIANDGTLFISYIGAVPDGDCIGYTESLQAIYKSTDGGMNWNLIPSTVANGLPCELFGQFGWYFEVLKVNPDNPDDMFLLGIDMYRTVDGGVNWFEASPGWWTYEVHADKHDLVYAHGTIYVGTDGGAYKTDIIQTNEWQDIENIPSTQFYRIAWNPHLPDLYYGGAQDNGTTGGNASVINQWPRIWGGDGFQPLFDPTEPLWMYALTQNGVVWYSDDGGFDFEGLNKGLEGSRYWDMPLVMSKHDPKILFCGSDRVFRMNMLDSIREWKEISPDLTRGVNILGSRYPTITSIAQSDLDEQRLYAGTQDGLIWTSGDGGVNWSNITDGTPGFYVTSITCSTTNPTGVVATYSGYRDNDHQPYIYRSEDAGTNWVPIVSDLPMLGVNSFFILPGWDDAILFAATDGGVYVSEDAGTKWERMGTNMPYMPIYDLDYNPVENKLIAGTFSRGIMTFPIEELDLVSSIDQDETANHKLNVQLFPTITKDQLFISLNTDDEYNGDLKVTIFNMEGKVMRYSYEKWNEVYKVTFLNQPSPGVYRAQVQLGEKINSVPFIVQ